MPRRKSLTEREKVFVETMAETGDFRTAQHRAGIKHQPNASAMLARPIVQSAIVEHQTKVLYSDILPLAVAAHRRLLTDPRTPAGAVVSAVKLAYDRTLGMQEVQGSKEPFEMTPEELANAISNLERVKVEKARPVLELTATEGSLFD